MLRFYIPFLTRCGSISLAQLSSCPKAWKTVNIIVFYEQLAPPLRKDISLDAAQSFLTSLLQTDYIIFSFL
jgi:hypothetical protein